MAKQLKSGDIKKHMLWSQPGQEDVRRLWRPWCIGTCWSGYCFYTALQKISNGLAGLEDIRRTTSLVNVKLTSLISRMGDVEKRVEWQKRVIKRQVLLDADPMATLATLFFLKRIGIHVTVRTISPYPIRYQDFLVSNGIRGDCPSSCKQAWEGNDLACAWESSRVYL